MNTAVRFLPAAAFAVALAVSPSIVRAQAPQAGQSAGKEQSAAIVHPEPNPNANARGVLSGRRFARMYFPAAVRSYNMVAEIPQVIDGIYSYCGVGRSLLNCFESEAAALCGRCLAAAQLAYTLHQDGHGLPEIRKRLDSGVLDH